LDAWKITQKVLHPGIRRHPPRVVPREMTRPGSHETKDEISTARVGTTETKTTIKLNRDP
jgi:hypothetical protein